MRLGLTQIKLLLALDKHQLNLTRAAAELNIVQPAATRQLRLLEETLGIRLFEREGKRLKAWTAPGCAILEQARVMVMAEKNILTLAQAAKSEEEEITLATTHTQAKYYLPSRLRQFREHYPHVQLHIVQGAPCELVNWLKNADVDLALCTEAIAAANSLERRFCYRWHYVLIAPVQHPLLEKSALKLADIVQYPVLTYSRGFSGGAQIGQAFQAEGLNVRFAVRAADTDVIKTYVREGLGVGIIAQQGYDAQQDQGLGARSLAALLPENETFVAWRKSQVLTPAQQAFVSLLQTQDLTDA